MCQHVRGRRAGSSQRGDRETGVSLCVPGCRPTQLRNNVVIIVVDLDDASPAASVVIPPRWFDHGEHDNDDQCHDDDDEHVEKQQWRRRPGRSRGSQLAGQKEIPENTREIGEPRRCSGGWHDRMADLRVLPESIDNGGKCHICWSTVGVEEAGSSKSLQPGSGGGRDAGPIRRNGAPPCRFQNRFYPAARPQGGRQTVHCRQDAFLSRSFPSSVQVRNDIIYHCSE